jgi:hypothetical protein
MVAATSASGFGAPELSTLFTFRFYTFPFGRGFAAPAGIFFKKGRCKTRVLPARQEPLAGGRGGAWNNQPQNVACANRNNNDPNNRNNNIGFRCAKTPYRFIKPVSPESGSSWVAGAWATGVHSICPVSRPDAQAST